MLFSQHLKDENCFLSFMGFFIRICYNSYFCFSICNVFFKFSCDFLFNIWTWYNLIYVFVLEGVLLFILFGVLWAFWILNLVSVINFGKCVTDISLNTCFLPWSLPQYLFFWNSKCAYIKLFGVVPQLLDVCSLGFWGFFLLFHTNCSSVHLFQITNFHIY